MTPSEHISRQRGLGGLIARMFGLRQGQGASLAASADLHATGVAQARRPEFFGPGRVPDTIDGRYDMIVLHLFLLLRRLKAEGKAGQTVARTLTERMFDDFDRGVRELGVGDLGVARRIKAMARGFHGRVHAYDQGLDDHDPAVLGEALTRNLFGTVESVDPAFVSRMAAYVRAADAALAAVPSPELLTGTASFPDFLEPAA